MLRTDVKVAAAQGEMATGIWQLGDGNWDPAASSLPHSASQSAASPQDMGTLPWDWQPACREVGRTTSLTLRGEGKMHVPCRPVGS